MTKTSDPVEKIIGDPNLFGIRYLPCPIEYNYEQPDKYAICHLIFDNTIIGSPTEECYLPTWYPQLIRHRNFIQNNLTVLYPKSFIGLTDREIFELIIKTNQVEDEFDEKYLYLPQLNSSLWSNHTFFIDETIDAFAICFYILENNMKFLIEKTWPLQQENTISSFIYPEVKADYFLNVLNETIHFLELTYPYLSEYKKP